MSSADLASVAPGGGVPDEELAPSVAVEVAHRGQGVAEGVTPARTQQADRSTAHAAQRDNSRVGRARGQHEVHLAGLAGQQVVVTVAVVIARPGDPVADAVVLDPVDPHPPRRTTAGRLPPRKPREPCTT